MLGYALLALGANSAFAQAGGESNRPLAAVIDAYVQEGLRSNLALRAQTLEVERPYREHVPVLTYRNRQDDVRAL